jgi:hypothetical protein
MTRLERYMAVGQAAGSLPVQWWRAAGCPPQFRPSLLPEGAQARLFGEDVGPVLFGEGFTNGGDVLGAADNSQLAARQPQPPDRLVGREPPGRLQQFQELFLRQVHRDTALWLHFRFYPRTVPIPLPGKHKLAVFWPSEAGHPPATKGLPSKRIGSVGLGRNSASI